MKILALFIFAFSLNANVHLIKEMESLRNSLPLKDRARPKMTLRLADLYFEKARNDEKEFLLKGTGSEAAVNKTRAKAIKLYKESLSGSDGVFKKPEGSLEVKINFQLARLYHRSKDIKTAMPHYKFVVDSTKPMNQLKREANLSLAEIYEEKSGLKKADAHYVAAKALCHGGDTCSYIHYRRAWVLYKNMDLEGAISEIEKSLFDSKGQVKERSLQDYLVFLSNRTTDGMREISIMETMVEKTGKPDLMRQLMEAYFSNGNRKAALNFLSYLNQKSPNLYDQIRMAEETYGFKMWEKLDETLTQIESAKSLDALNEKNRKASLEIFKRLIVQLDAERQTNPSAKNYLQRSIMIFLTFFPQHESRNKMMQGWLTAESQNRLKVDQLKVFIEMDTNAGLFESASKFRIMRLSLAQKEKIDEIILEESLALSKYFKGKDEAKYREYSYVYGYKNYELKKNDIALPIFENLSKVSERAPDKWAIQAQNLALDIYSQKKDYMALVKKTDSWLSQKSNWKDAKVQKELGEIAGIKKQARFEYAASLGTHVDALAIFKEYCLSNTFKKKSCTNAKVLSVKLNDQDALISILEHLDDKKALLNEYELMGSFEKAAPLFEKLVLNKEKSIENFLKSALLYELALDTKMRDSKINDLAQFVRKQGKIDKEFEPVLYRLIKEANLLSAKTLTMPWSLTTKLFVARELDALGKADKKAKKVLLGQKEMTGATWARYHIKRIEKLHQDQAKISFYGRYSKSRFNKRLKKLEKYKSVISKVVQGADAYTRSIIFDLASKSYEEFASKIMSTPIPEGLDEAQLAQINENLKQMAAPFVAESQNYTKLKNEQLLKVDEEKRLMLVDSLAKTTENYAELIEGDKVEEITTIALLPKDEYKQKLSALQKDPTNINLLKDIKNFLTANSQGRMAAYFNGRINNLENKTESL